MVNYGSLTEIERVVMGTLVIFTNGFGIISIVALFRRKGLEFQAMVAFMAVFTSTMYHLCQVLNFDIYLPELKWHRLDNVFVIAGIAIWTLHVSGNGHVRKAIYLSLVISILTQEKDPWNINFTILPIIFFDILALVLRLWYWSSVKVKYDWRRLGMSLSILGIGSYFFYKGLNEHDDYLRFNHGIWHLMAAVSNYYGMSCCTWEYKEKKPKIKI